MRKQTAKPSKIGPENRLNLHCRDSERLRARACTLRAQARRAGVDFLHLELQVADSLLAVAESTSDSDTRLRNLGNARVALLAVQRFSEKLAVTSVGRDNLRNRCDHLSLRLKRLLQDQGEVPSR